MSTSISKQTFQFLSDLEKNNNREWFNDHKALYTEAHENTIEFIEHLIDELGHFDEELKKIDAKKSLFRIYRDTRFSKNKEPYKNNFGASLGMGKGSQKAGFYIHIQPEKSFIGGGLYHPESPNLKKVRNEISLFHDEFLKIIENKDFKKIYGKLNEDDKLVKVPNGFEKDHPLGEYLKLKSFVALHPMADSDFQNPKSIDNIVNDLKVLHPLNNYINIALGAE